MIKPFFRPFPLGFVLERNRAVKGEKPLLQLRTGRTLRDVSINGGVDARTERAIVNGDQCFGIRAGVQGYSLAQQRHDVLQEVVFAPAAHPD
jgi:hypothetical protein